MIDSILQKAEFGGRLSFDEGVLLLQSDDLMSLGRSAHSVRNRIHPGSTVTYIIDRNINYSNVCIAGCRFCAFSRNKNDDEAYVISEEDLFSKIEETIKLSGKQILLQGGLHPDLGIEYYENLLRSIKERYDIHVHGFSPPEIIHMCRISSLGIEEAIMRLKNAGLGSIPGGGAEILVDRVRAEISSHKCSTEEWLQVMRCAHLIGLRSTATMMFGHIETLEDRVEHMMRIRELQDETGGFTAFIPWTFQPENTRLGGEKRGGVEYLKTLAFSRLMLDNVENIQASWVTQGPKAGQISLFFGANDMGSTMIEENVVKAAGVEFTMTEEMIVEMINEAGFHPKRRNVFYEIM